MAQKRMGPTRREVLWNAAMATGSVALAGLTLGPALNGSDATLQTN